MSTYSRLFWLLCGIQTTLTLIQGREYADSQSLSDQEQRGQYIYRHGRTPEGELIPTYIGSSTQAAPSQLFACINCHGRKGTGVAEGGIQPADIRWHTLTKPNGVITASHRQRPAYNEAQVIATIKNGIDPAGNHLQTVMPRFDLKPQDSAALIAYLKVLHRVEDPGIHPEAIQIGMILPSDPSYELIAKQARASIKSVNDAGGLYRRKLNLHLLRLSEDPANWPKAYSDFLQQDSMFVCLSPFIDPANYQICADLITQSKVPVLAPLIENPPVTEIPNPYIFHLYPSIDAQIKALEHYSKSELPNYQTVLKPTLEQLCTYKKLETQALIFKEAPTEAVFKHLQQIGWQPTILLPSAWMPPQAILHAYAGNWIIAQPTQGGWNAPKVELYASMSKVATQLLFEQFLKMGRQLTREQFIREMESLHQYTNRYIGPISFDANQRIGTQGAFLTQIQNSGVVKQLGWFSAYHP